MRLLRFLGREVVGMLEGFASWLTGIVFMAVIVLTILGLLALSLAALWLLFQALRFVHL